MNIYDAISGYLAKQMRTGKEVELKLKEKGFDGEKIKEVIEEYKNLKYIDDGAYAAAFFRMAFRKGKSKARAYQELSLKGVSREDIDAGYEELLEENDAEILTIEKERARLQIERILTKEGLSRDDAVDERLYNKLGRRLAALGYEGSIIYSLLGEMKRKY
ncbi:RecX family protein [Peptostreptococcaceae bacterium pGA-8]|nr:RecX family protein [Peptostreptococcaceae bacterium pGA-8]